MTPMLLLMISFEVGALGVYGWRSFENRIN